VSPIIIGPNGACVQCYQNPCVCPVPPLTPEEERAIEKALHDLLTYQPEIDDDNEDEAR
jgi:hypothetical protein